MGKAAADRSLSAGRHRRYEGPFSPDLLGLDLCRDAIAQSGRAPGLRCLGQKLRDAFSGERPRHDRRIGGACVIPLRQFRGCGPGCECHGIERAEIRSEEHTSELQSLMRISYAVFCLKKKKQTTNKKYQYN